MIPPQTIRKLPARDLEAVLADDIIPWSPRNAEIIRVYWAGETMTAIAKQWREEESQDISRNLVSQIIQKFLRVCRHPSKWKLLSDEAKAVFILPGS